MQKKNCITSLICAAVFLFFFFQCSALTETAAQWPRMICTVGLLLSILEAVLEGVKWSKTTGQQEKMWPLSGEQTKRSLILLGLLILWIAGLTTIGFLVSSVVALCVIAIVFEPIRDKKHLIRDIVVCVIFGIIFYVTFKFLGIHFPRALLL